MIRCPRCKSGEIRVHGGLVDLSWAPRWWIVGPLVPKIRTVAAECSCGDCLHAFVSRPEGTKDAPVQNARDALASAMDAALGKGRTSQGAEDAKVVPLPRPAPDPRVRRR